MKKIKRPEKPYAPTFLGGGIFAGVGLAGLLIYAITGKKWFS